MKRLFLPTTALAGVLFFSACSTSTNSDQPADAPGDEQEDNIEVNDSTALVFKNDKYTLTEVLSSPEYPKSTLKVITPEVGDMLDEGNVSFQFEVTGGDYELGAQTSDADIKMCANSGKGQHVHLIINNGPYEASYGTEYTTKNELEEGNYVALAFLSRSYHMSCKHEGAAVLTQFQVGDEPQDEADLEAPHLFYSRPKGEYDLSGDQKLLLDFYLVNTTLGVNGNYVKVTFDDDVENSLNVTKWAPFFIEGLGAGKHKVKIELMNKDNIFIEGPFNAGEREFKITNRA